MTRSIYRDSIRGKRLLPLMFFMIVGVITGFGQSRSEGGDLSKSDVVVPDFSMPREAAKSGYLRYEKNIKDCPPAAIAGVIEWIIAEEMVTNDSTAAIYQKLEKLPAEFASNPAYARVCRLLEARFLSSVYSANRRNYDQRRLPLGETSQNPLEWSGDQFRRRISQLCDEAIADPQVLVQVPLRDCIPFVAMSGDFSQISMSPVADDTASQRADYAQNYDGFTLLDFVTYEVIDTRSLVGLDNADYTVRLLNNLVEADTKLADGNPAVRDAALLTARLQLLEQTNQRDGSASLPEKVREIIDDYKTTPVYDRVLSLLFTSAYGSLSQSEQQKFYKVIVDALENVADESDEKLLQSVRQRIEAADVSVRAEGQVLPGEKITVQWHSKSRRQFDVLLVKVPAALYVEQQRSGKSDYERLLKSAQMIAVEHVDCDKPYPFTADGEVTFDGVPAGCYAVVLAEGSTLKDVKSGSDDVAIINVSNLSTFKVRNGDREMFYVVSAVNGQPVGGATVNYTQYKYERGVRKSAATGTIKTKGDGLVEWPVSAGQLTVSVAKGDNLICFEEYIGGSRVMDTGRNSDLTLLTDLAIYHPGDTIGFVGVAIDNDRNRLRACEGLEMQVRLYNPNNQVVDSVACVTDVTGRVSGKLYIPTSGITGQYTLRADAHSGISRREITGYAGVEVADYKAPTIRVSLSQPTIEYADNTVFGKTDNQNVGSTDGQRDITLTGLVTTYAGMPVAGSKVSVSIVYDMWWPWLRRAGDASNRFALDAITDAEGRYAVTIDAERLKECDPRRGTFNATASAVSPTGETAESESVIFSLGNRYTFASSLPAQLKVNDNAQEVTLNVGVKDAIGNDVTCDVLYEIEREYPSESGVKLTGSFESPALRLPAASLPSGKYRMKFIARSRVSSPDVAAVSDTLVSDVTVFRADDTKAPCASSVWTPERQITAPSGAKRVKVRVGNNYDGSAIFMMVSRSLFADERAAASDGLIEKRWITSKGGMMDVEVDAPQADERVRVSFFGMHKLQAEVRSVEILPAEQTAKPEIVTETFRDKVTPGAGEEWRFKLSIEGKIAERAAFIAVMSNKALNALMPFEWHFNPKTLCRYNFATSLNTNVMSGNYLYVDYTKPFKAVFARMHLPEWRMYGEQLYSTPVYTGSRRLYKSAGFATTEYAVSEMKLMSVNDKAAAVVQTSDYGQAEAADEVVEDVSGRGEDGVNTANETGEKLTLRSMECPLAFFKPMLVTATVQNPEARVEAHKAGLAPGEVAIDFSVPDFNTTWQFQLIGYDPSDMQSAGTVLSVVASKPVMISTNAPRFLRTGDETVLRASVYNNTEDDMDISTVMDIFNLETGAVYASRTTDLTNIAPKASRMVSIEYKVPVGITQLAIRCRANSDKGSDGEQTVIAILPSTEVVRDATTFYIDDKDTKATVKLPEMRAGDMVTLEYCDNPEWYVLMSLADVKTPESDNALALSDALYALSTGSGLLKNNRRLSEVLRRVVSACDTMGGEGVAALTSPLAQNDNLKMSGLEPTPWLDNAASETARMRSVSSLLDSNAVEASESEMLSRLKELQNADGGWSWWRNMPSSRFITIEVLSRFAALRTGVNMPEIKAGDIYVMIKDAIEYCDRSVVEEYTAIVNRGEKYTPGQDEILYFYLRDKFDQPMTKSIARISSLTAEMATKEWRRFDVSGKCLAAMMLNDEINTVSHRDAVQSIMKSVSEFSSYSPLTGRRFDRATSPYSRFSPVETAALALMAYREAAPENEEMITGLRQYLLLSRQTQDWHNGMTTAQAVLVAQAVLSAAGESSRSVVNTARIAIGGEELDLQKEVAAGRGVMTPCGFTLSLDASRVSGKQIEINRDAGAPAWGGIMSVRELPMKDVKPQNMPQLKVSRAYYPVKAVDGHESVGRGTTTYEKGEKVRVTLMITTDRELDYLAVRDSRAACMEPCSQLTGYEYKDGLPYVIEQRGSATNLYFYRVPKGVFVVCYEVVADRDGDYSAGTLTAQSYYYPQITARSGAAEIEVETSSKQRGDVSADKSNEN